MTEREASAGPAGPRQLIQGYGLGGFKVAGRRHAGSIILFPDRARPWNVASGEDIDHAALAEILARANFAELLLIGCGPKFLPPPAAVARAVKSAGLGLEWMTTAAACRTWNVLVGDHRAVIAALIAVD